MIPFGNVNAICPACYVPLEVPISLSELVTPIPDELIRTFDGRTVRSNGTLIFRFHEAVVEHECVEPIDGDTEELAEGEEDAV